MPISLHLSARQTPRIILVLVALVAALVVLLLPVATAAAHKPLFPDRDISSPASAWRIPDPNVSWAVYATLDHPGGAHYYDFDAKAGFALDAQITIPAITSEQQFAPHLALIGPGISGGALAETAGLVIPTGLGVQVLDAPNAGATNPFDEPFTQTRYWQRQDLKVALPTTGHYYLAVFSLTTDPVTTGKYVLAVGTKEEFGPGDLVTFPVTYAHVRAFTEAGVPLWGWVVVGVIVVLVLLRLRVRSQRQKNKTPLPQPAEVETLQ